MQIFFKPFEHSNWQVLPSPVSRVLLMLLLPKKHRDLFIFLSQAAPPTTRDESSSLCIYLSYNEDNEVDRDRAAAARTSSQDSFSCQIWSPLSDKLHSLHKVYGEPVWTVMVSLLFSQYIFLHIEIYFTVLNPQNSICNRGSVFYFWLRFSFEFTLMTYYSKLHRNEDTAVLSWINV